MTLIVQFLTNVQVIKDQYMQNITVSFFLETPPASFLTWTPSPTGSPSTHL